VYLRTVDAPCAPNSDAVSIPPSPQLQLPPRQGRLLFVEMEYSTCVLYVGIESVGRCFESLLSEQNEETPTKKASLFYERSEIA
jgi:hypothetical protein